MQSPIKIMGASSRCRLHNRLANENGECSQCQEIEAWFETDFPVRVEAMVGHPDPKIVTGTVYTAVGIVEKGKTWLCKNPTTGLLLQTKDGGPGGYIFPFSLFKKVSNG